MGKALADTLGLLRRMLSGEPLTAKIAAGHLNSKEPAARHVLDTMSESLAPWVEKHGKRDRVYRFVWPQDRRSDAFGVSALRLAREMLSFLHGSLIDLRLKELADDAARRVDTASPPADIARMFVAKTRAMSPHGIEADTMDQIVQCLFEQRRIETRYEHFHGRVDRLVIEPWSLVFGDEGLYLYGRVDDADDDKYIDSERTLHVGRIRSARTLEERAAYPSTRQYDPQERFRHCWGIFLPPEGETVQDVTLEFQPRWGAYLRSNRWHETQSEPDALPDGWFAVRFRLYLTQDLVRWVRSHGNQLRVAAPERLARWVETGEDPVSGAWG